MYHEFPDRAVHSAEAEILADPKNALTLADQYATDEMFIEKPEGWHAAGYRIEPAPARSLEHGDMVDLGDRAFEVVHTPGHSPGGIGLFERRSGIFLSGDIIYDLGANIGFMTLLFAKETGSSGHVHAFEALPTNVARLTHNIKLNGFQNWVTIVPAAVMDKSGTAEFLIGPSTGMGKVSGSAGRSSIEYSESIQVEGLAIDEYIEKRGNSPPKMPESS